MEDLNLDIAEILKYAAWVAVGLTVLSTLLTMRRARKWTPIGTRLVLTATIGSALTLGSLLWTHRARAWLVPTLALVAAGLIAGWVSAQGLNVRRSSLGAVAKRSVLWAAVWGAGLATIQMGAATNTLNVMAPAIAAVGLGTGALLGVGIRLLSKSRKLPPASATRTCPNCRRPTAQRDRFCINCGSPATVPQMPPPPPPPAGCRQCNARLDPQSRFCSRCGVAVLQDARRGVLPASSCVHCHRHAEPLDARRLSRRRPRVLASVTLA